MCACKICAKMPLTLPLENLANQGKEVAPNEVLLKLKGLHKKETVLPITNTFRNCNIDLMCCWYSTVYD